MKDLLDHLLNPILRAPENEGGAGNVGAGDEQAGGAGDPPGTGENIGKEGADLSGGDPFAALSDDAATRDWLKAQNLSDAKAIAKKAHEQEKLIGSTLRPPAEDASDEEKAAFADKALAAIRPKDASAYAFDVPKDLPADLPYDDTAASSFKEAALDAGLTKGQAAKLHDWFVGYQTSSYKQAVEGAPEQLAQVAAAQRQQIEKVWGPLDGNSAKANAEFADRTLAVAPPELVQEFVKAGMIGNNKEVLNANFAFWLADVGAALYKEADVLKGDANIIGNPFAEGQHFNLTAAMQLYKADKDRAFDLIRAAGKKPEDFGLKA